MNHSESFWALLDSMTDGESTALRDELKDYQPSI
jgi:predicted metal-dependent hydrolase